MDGNEGHVTYSHVFAETTHVAAAPRGFACVCCDTRDVITSSK